MPDPRRHETISADHYNATRTMKRVPGAYPPAGRVTIRCARGCPWRGCEGRTEDWDVVARRSRRAAGTSAMEFSTLCDKSLVEKRPECTDSGRWPSIRCEPPVIAAVRETSFSRRSRSRNTFSPIVKYVCSYQSEYLHCPFRLLGSGDRNRQYYTTILNYYYCKILFSIISYAINGNVQ